MTGTNNPVTLLLTNLNPTVSAAFAVLGSGNRSLTVISEGQGRTTVSPYAT